MSNAIDQILRPYDEGKSCIVLQGRSLYDLELNPEGGIQPLIEILRKQAFVRHNLVLVQYSRSSGITYDLRDLGQDAKNLAGKVLRELKKDEFDEQRQHGGDSDEFVMVLRSLLNLGMKTNETYVLKNGMPLRFLIVIEYPEHLLPHVNSGTHTVEQIIAIELALKLTNSLGYRKSRNFTILAESRTGLMDALIYQNLDSINVPQPVVEEKKLFLEALLQRYQSAHPAEGLSNEIIANLCSGTPHRSLESIVLSSERTGLPFAEQELVSKKQSDIVALSEGTLELLDNSRVRHARLFGTTIQKPIEILMKIASALKKGETNIPRNICLCGAPSTGKTVLALIAADRAGVPAFNLVSPKSQWVGETERKTKVMLSLLKQLGGIGIIDELELQFPMDRNQSSQDSGVTQNLIGQLQSFLADTSMAGKTLLLGTSNRPNAISEAMRQRWIILPVLMPIEQDFPGIVQSIALELNPEFDWTFENEEIVESAERFFSAGAAPREIREALIASQAVINGKLGIEHIVFASHDMIPSGNRLAGIFSDYAALNYCRNNSFLPWWDEKKSAPEPHYPYPDYIKDIMTDDFFIDKEKLQKRLRELQPHVNV